MPLFSTAQIRNLEPLFAKIEDRDAALSLEALHGFFFGLAITPETVMPREWLPVIYGPDGPVFDSDRDAQTCLGHLFEIYNLFMRDSHQGRLHFPFNYATMADEEFDLIEEWAYGLYEALTLRPELWGFSDEYADLPDEDLPPGLLEVIDACEIITAVALPEERDTIVRTAPGREPKSAEQVAAVLISMLPECVRIVQAYGAKIQRRRFPARRAPAVGRNEPCPCGSGKKYKKCCGAS